MKKSILIIITILLASCGGGTDKSFNEIAHGSDLDAIRSKKSELVANQQNLNSQIEQLDKAIEKLDNAKKVSLVTTFITKEEIFNHYLELQGSVTTKSLLVLYPEYSGTLTQLLVKNGQRVSKGQLLAKIDDGGLEQQLTQLQIQQDLAKTTYDRQNRLWDQKIGSEMQYLQAKSNYESQSKAVSQLERQLAKTMVVAPFSGTIDDVITEQGSVVMQGQTPLMRLINLNNMYIESDIPEKHISNVTKNKDVVVEFPILGRSINSKVREVGNYINPDNRTFKVEIGIPNKDKSIKPNLTAKLKINDYTNKQALLIPQNVISENASGQQYVYIAIDKKDNGEAIAKKVIVETGKSQMDKIEILDGLASRSEIILEGARSVNDGQTIKIINQ